MRRRARTLAIQRWKYGMTVETCVCWSITIEENWVRMSPVGQSQLNNGSLTLGDHDLPHAPIEAELELLARGAACESSPTLLKPPNVPRTPTGPVDRLWQAACDTRPGSGRRAGGVARAWTALPGPRETRRAGPPATLSTHARPSGPRQRAARVASCPRCKVRKSLTRAGAEQRERDVVGCLTRRPGGLASSRAPRLPALLRALLLSCTWSP